MEKKSKARTNLRIKNNTIKRGCEKLIVKNYYIKIYTNSFAIFSTNKLEDNIFYYEIVKANIDIIDRLKSDGVSYSSIFNALKESVPMEISLITFQNYVRKARSEK